MLDSIQPIKETNDLYRSLIEASLDPMVTISPEGLIVDVNEAMSKIIGLAQEKMNGSDFFLYFTDPALARDVYQKTFVHGVLPDIPLTLCNQTGKLTYVLLSGSVYLDPQRKIKGAVIAARDVAEGRWSTQLQLANKKLAFQDDEKEKWAGELVIANKELAFQNEEKEKRAQELKIANEELAIQNHEKEERAAELIRLNEELKGKEQQLSNQINAIAKSNATIEFDLNGIILAASDNFLEIMGYSEKEIVGKHHRIFVDKTYAETKEYKQFWERLKKGQYQKDEFKSLNKTGDFVWLLGSYNPILDADGNPSKVLKIATDVTLVRKQVLELAQQAEEKEKRAAELVIANKELAFQNNEKEKRAEELRIANKELAFQNNEKEKRAAELVVANKELAFQNEEKIKRAAELQIANYARGLIEASRDPLVTISPEGKITDTNQATVNITGIKRKKLIGSDFFDYFTEPQMAREVYQEVFAKGSVADSPLTLRHKKGKLTDVLFNGSIYKNDQGNDQGVVIVARDVTDQKRIATELMEAKEAAELATKIAEVAQAKAESATILAEDAVKAKQQFLSNMSHEIRTPMNAIIGFTKVMLKTELSEKQLEYLKAIKLSGDALIVLINDILDLAKVDAGKMVFEQIPFKLTTSVSAMVHLFETKIQEKNIGLVKEFDPRIPEIIIGDPVRLHQIMLNLLSNALKFTSSGKITVSVRMLVQDKDKVILEFSVSDTGIGIHPSKLESVFENFQQATSGTSRLYGGTGLGLAIVKNLVEPQGGSITVKSIVDEGSTFSFILSFNKTHELIDVGSDLGVELEAGLKGKRILVVEDIALNQLLMKTLLEDFGFTMEVARNGKIALEMLASNTYDLILMDLQMPEMNGFEATQIIRHQLHLDVPIIALTADVTTVDVEKCKAVGMNDYISKPIDDKLLYSKIIKYLKMPGLNKLQAPARVGDLQTEPIRTVNFGYLRRITKTNARMTQMITIYLQEIPQLVLTMKQAIGDRDWELLKISTHSIIPTFLTMGINSEFEDMAKAIQAIATNMLTNSAGKEVSDEILAILETLQAKIAIVCAQAAEEMEAELEMLAVVGAE